MRMSESTDRVLRSRSRSIVRQRRISTDHVTNTQITEKEVIWKKTATFDDSSRVIGELGGKHESAVFEDRLHGNGDVEINDNLVNENFVRHFEEEESPWQNGHYKPVSEIVAYYRSLGDWWNVLPKTDYTYNPMSKWYRKEIAPGIPMIPNMARPPLHPYTPKASFFGWFTREQTNTRSSARDTSVSSSCSSAVKVSWYRRLMTTVVTAVTTIWLTVTSVTHVTAGRTHNVNGIHAQRLKGRQLFQESNAWWRLPFVWLYRLMMNILAVDIGILAAVRRSANKLRSSRTGVELVTLLLLLLPLILFFGFYRDQFPHHKALLVDTVESSRSWISSSLSGMFGWISASLSNIFGSGSGMISSSLSGMFGWISASLSNTFGSGYELISSSLFGLFGWISASLSNAFGLGYVTISSSLSGLFGWISASLSNAFGWGYVIISSSLSGILGWISASLSSIFGWGSGLFSSVGSYWSQSQRSCEAGYFDLLIDSISSGLITVGQSAWQFMLYLYSFLLLLPTLLPSLPSAATIATGSVAKMAATNDHLQPAMSREQLIGIVQEAVRSTLKQDSAQLVDDTVRSEKLRVLLDQVLAEKVKNWDPSVMLTSEQWRAAVKEAVHIYHVENPNKEGEIINRRIDIIEKELNDRITKLEGKMDLLVDKFVTRKTVEDAIKNLTRHFNYQMKIEGEHVMERVLAEITEKVKDEVTTLFYSLKRNHNQVELTTPGEMNLTQVQDYVSVMIERALCLYDADKTGMVDYALESSGGHVLNTRCTESYNGGHQTYVLFGFALWRSSNSPRTLIQPGMHPGECWAFSGQQGYVVLQLSSTIIVTGFTLEHIPRSLAPHGRIDSAPKDFSVWGLRDEDDKEEMFLGRYRFQENGTSLQMFKANAVEDPFRLVELKIESNHGNLEYTCLYRFRVHGVPVS